MPSRNLSFSILLSYFHRLGFLSSLHQYVIIIVQKCSMMRKIHITRRFCIYLFFILAITSAQSSLRRQVLEASSRDFHLARSAATPGAVSMVRPLLSRSFRAVLRQVSFGRPLFLYVNQFQKSSRFVNLVCVASVVFVYQDQITTKIPKTIFLFHYAEKHKNSAKVLWPDLIKIGCAAIDSWYILKSVGMYKYTALKRDHITS